LEPEAEDQLLKDKDISSSEPNDSGSVLGHPQHTQSHVDENETSKNERMSKVEVVALPPAIFSSESLNEIHMNDNVVYHDGEESGPTSKPEVDKSYGEHVKTSEEIKPEVMKSNDENQLVSALKERISQLKTELREKNEIISRLNSIWAREQNERDNSVISEDVKNENGGGSERKRRGSFESAGLVALAIGKLAEGREKAILRKIKEDKIGNDDMENNTLEFEKGDTVGHDGTKTESGRAVNSVVLAAGKLAAGRERLVTREIAHDISERTPETLNENAKQGKYDLTLNSGLRVAVAAGKFSELREKAIMRKIEEDQLGEEIDSLVNQRTNLDGDDLQ